VSGAGKAIDVRCVLRARWQGPLPVASEYLMARGHRARFAYRIVEVEQRSKDGDITHLMLTVDRLPIADVPDGATVHEWRWDQRGRNKGAAWSAS
jgi:hypothetical protein